MQKRYWPGTKAIMTQCKSDTDPVQKRYWPGTKAIPFDTVLVPLHNVPVPSVPEPVTIPVLLYGTGTVCKTCIRKVPYRYLVPNTTIPNRYCLPPLNSTGTGTDRYRNVYWDVDSRFSVTMCRVCCDVSSVTMCRVCCDVSSVTMCRVCCDVSSVTMCRVCCDVSSVTMYRVCCDVSCFGYRTSSWWIHEMYRKVSNIRRTKYQNSNDSRLIL